MGADRANPGGAGGKDEGGRDRGPRGQEEGGGALAHLQDSPPEVEVNFKNPYDRLT